MLHTREWGRGDRVAVLIHGIMADSRCWWRVGPALAERGYRVIAVDLPGHGDSPRAEEYTPELYASSVLESVPATPELAIGHSLGGLTLSLAVGRLKPGRAVYSDPAFRIPKIDGVDFGAMMASAKGQNMEMVRQVHPGWSAEECVLEIEMLAKWDPATARALNSFLGSDFTPEPVVPSLVQLADPSELISPEVAEALISKNFEVRVVKGAEHTIHRHLFDDFLAGLEGWI
ncbi:MULTISPECIES: alpha/beta fold hydrolase [Streptosporangium]|uniref:Pimeloyl-ACP methyl ester carboxylesterase n=1 Tax=Streptosporangium brasiliense TaxID=47480 RepID=A0ABT9R065_9ACTN|nr:alpha/beta hydrolase [Streptosporangium brasiliense]MDP9862237.1 pimeloyl-ACP methyl ester carboxylesterase [Streptosporangium brasiliense]